MPILLSGQTFHHQEWSLRPGARFSSPAIADVNRDGFPDLFVPQCPETGGDKNRISFFLNREGRFGSGPDQWISLNDDDALFDFADADGDADLDLFVMGSRGVFAHAFDGTVFRPDADTVLISSTVLPPFFSEPPQAWPFASGAIVNGSSLLLVPESDGVGIYSKKPGHGYKAAGRLDYARSRSLNTDGNKPFLTTRLPELRPYGHEGDPDPGCFFIFDNRAVFLDIGGSDPSRSDAFIREFRNFVPQTADSVDAGSQMETRLEFHDFDANGSPDALAILSPRPGIFTPPGQVRLTLNRPDGWNAVPDQIVLKDCFFGNHVIADFNGDGLADLCAITLETSVFDLARYVLDRRIRNRFDIHYGKPDGMFGQKPDRSAVFSRKQTLRGLFTEPLVEQPWPGDFNGDGIEDLALWSGRNELSLVFSRPEGGPDTGHPLRLPLQRTERVRIADLNRDGCSDIVLAYPDPLRGSVRILLSAAGGSG